MALYVVLGLALVGSRLVGLGQSFWHDEVVAVEDFIRAGPHEILAGPDLSHELFSLLAWATSRVVGESEIAFRLWSAVPFMAGVALVTVWLHGAGLRSQGCSSSSSPPSRHCYSTSPGRRVATASPFSP